MQAKQQLQLIHWELWVCNYLSKLPWGGLEWSGLYKLALIYQLIWPLSLKLWTWSRWFSATEMTMPEGADMRMLFADNTVNNWHNKLFIEESGVSPYTLHTHKTKLINWVKQHDLSVLYLLLTRITLQCQRQVSASRAGEQRAPVVSSLCDESWTEEWVFSGKWPTVYLVVWWKKQQGYHWITKTCSQSCIFILI